MNDLNSHWHIASNQLPIINIHKFVCDWTEKEPTTLAFYDNYDQQIRAANQYLFHHEGCYQLASDLEITSSVVHRRSDFASDIHDENLRNRLTKLIGLRKLEATLKLKVAMHFLALRDDEQKCVVKAKVLCSDNGVYIYAESLRGYQKAYQQFCKQLKKLGFANSQRFMYAQLFVDNLADVTPVPEVRKYLPQIHDKTAEAVGKMCTAMMDNARSHEYGVIHTSEDTEYLHDYRVSMRKTRSLVSLMKGIFPEEQHTQIKDRLAELMRPTNLARDLDVYLLEQHKYEAMLPENLREGLPLMFDDFRIQHSDAYSELKSWLSSDEYVKEVESCRAWFAGFDLSLLPKNASKSVALVIDKLVQNKFQKVIATGKLITPESPDDEVHELRLECKKFRYLLDFFGSVYPQAEMAKLLKKLKRMQNTLGLFNDYSVQQEALHDYLDKSRQNKKIHVSVGALILVLAQKQLEQRKQVEIRFSEFANAETAELLTVLITREEPPESAASESGAKEKVREKGGNNNKKLRERSGAETKVAEKNVTEKDVSQKKTARKKAPQKAAQKKSDQTKSNDNKSVKKNRTKQRKATKPTHKNTKGERA